MNFVFMRDRTVASTSGRTVEFKKGEPTYVPPQMYQEVIAAGGVPEDELPDDEAKKAEVPVGEDRKALIRAAMEDMVAANVREEFTAAGAPHNKVLSQKLGFTVDAKERDALWVELQQGKKD